VSKLHTRAQWLCRKVDLNPTTCGDEPLKVSGSTDTSVALADILKRECAGGSARAPIARLLAPVQDSYLRSPSL
jgi:hypothetical protein